MTTTNDHNGTGMSQWRDEPVNHYNDQQFAMTAKVGGGHHVPRGALVRLFADGPWRRLTSHRTGDRTAQGRPTVVLTFADGTEVTRETRDLIEVALATEVLSW